ncbi:MAG: hypothetical protein RL514_2640 [Verrucomicrobiota bacterium]|jgi:hypothetical protein
MNPPAELDEVTLFAAKFLYWARRNQIFGTFQPFISYRGQECEHWELLPSLCRGENKKLPLELLERIEIEVILAFRSRLALSEDWTEIEVLAFARHHGAPTRLLDWTTNALVGLWFAVADSQYDHLSGAVYQLLCGEPGPIGLSVSAPKGPASCKCGLPVHVFSSPAKIARPQRQSSVFSLAAFTGGYAVQPLDQIHGPEQKRQIRKFVVPAGLKRGLRNLLSDVGLDAYSIYGDPDSLGKAVSAKLDYGQCGIPFDALPKSGYMWRDVKGSPNEGLGSASDREGT